MIYLNTYQEKTVNQIIYIINVPINDYILDIIMKHYNLKTIPLTVKLILHDLEETNDNNKDEIFFEITIEKYCKNHKWGWDSMDYYNRVYNDDTTNSITIENWLKKHYSLTLDEIIQGDKLGLL